jgi:hypothetical protein
MNQPRQSPLGVMLIPHFGCAEETCGKAAAEFVVSGELKAEEPYI